MRSSSRRERGGHRAPVRKPGFAREAGLSEYPLWKAGKPLLSHLDIELTERCNNDCLHCLVNRPAGDPEAERRELTTGEWQRIIKEAAALGALSIRFTGGEPLLRDDFADLYEYTRRLGIKIFVFTNGRLVTPGIADLFARLPPLESVEVTVYGMTKTSYEKVSRVKGSFAEFERGVQRLIARKVPFIVKGAILPPNRLDRAAFESWARSLPGMRGKPPSYTSRFDLRSRRDSEARNEVIRRVRLSPEEVVALFNNDRGLYLKEMKEFCSKFMRPPGKRLFHCGVCHGASVDAYGRLQPCLLLRDPGLGTDLRTGSLEAALRTSFARLPTMATSNPGYLKRCARCFLMGLCEQCPAKSWAEHGTLDTPVEYACAIAHAVARDIGLLKEKENAWEIELWEERLEAWVRRNIS